MGPAITEKLSTRSKSKCAKFSEKGIKFAIAGASMEVLPINFETTCSAGWGAEMVSGKRNRISGHLAGGNKIRRGTDRVWRKSNARI